MRPRDRLFQAVSRRPSPIPSRRLDGPVPLSWPQERFLLLEELAPGTTIWQIHHRYRLRGPLDIATLEQALRDLHARHDVLRTRVITRDHRFYQESTRNELEQRVLDLRGLDAAERDVRVEALDQLMSRPFDLATGPLWRVGIARVADDESLLLLRFHHLIMDAGSTGIFLRDLAELYTARRSGRASALPPLTRQYSDYAAWQRGPVAADGQAGQLGYWTTHLRGAHSLELPTDRRRPVERSRRAGMLDFPMPPAALAAIRGISEREEATLFMGLLTVFQLMLARYCGTNDVVVATPVADSRDRGTVGLIGPFINTIILRVDLDAVDDFATALQRVRDTVIDGLEHKDVPLEHVMRALRTSGGDGGVGLNVMFSMPPSRPPPSLPEITLETILKPALHTEFDLELWFIEQNLDGRLIYDADLFDHASVERMARHFQELLAQVIAEPSRSLATIDLLAPEERARIEAWNRTARAEETAQTIHERVAQQVTQSADSIAVVCKDVELTYRALAERTDRVAGWLASRGVSRGDRVVVSVERSVDMVVAVLAVLRVGAAYVPIDPEYPAARRDFIRSNAGAVVDLTDSTLREALTSTGYSMASAPPAAVTGEDPAYVIYTSGSTGTPKGVCVPHRAVTNFLTSMQRAPGLSSADTLLAVTTLSFDIAGLELYLPLTTGAKVVIASDTQARDGEQLAALIAACGATIMQATPATWRMLLATGWRPSPRLRVLCGGEALPSDLATSLTSYAASMWNLYGPTETTIWSTCTEVASGQPITIGAPIDNTRIYVVDAALRQTPIGLPGELCIGGSGLAHGYLARPDLTSEKFVADPFSQLPGARMYRTGDLARWRSDGMLEHLGRLDHQVKVRGFRIELGEIEAVLRELVRDVAVIVREDRAGDPRLVAYVVSPTVSIEGLRDLARSKLPDYMVPSAFVVLDALPLTPNAKIDRRALPVPDGAVGSRYVAARTPEEETLVQMWQDVLGVPRVGVHDDFFAIGGHSLHAIRFVAQVRAQLRVELPLSSVFLLRTIEALGRELEALRSTTQTMIPLVRADHGDTPPLSRVQSRIWFHHQLEPELNAYVFAFSGRMRGSLDIEALRRALETLVERHEVLRTVFPVVEGVPYPRVLPPPAWTLVVETGLDRDDVIAAEHRRPLDLAIGPLFRSHLLRLADDDHVLVLVLHHLVYDGWSMDLLWSELAELYSAFVEQRAPQLPALAVRYIDYAAWEQQWLDSPRCATTSRSGSSGSPAPPRTHRCLGGARAHRGRRSTAIRALSASARSSARVCGRLPAIRTRRST